LSEVAKLFNIHGEPEEEAPAAEKSDESKAEQVTVKK